MNDAKLLTFSILFLSSLNLAAEQAPRISVDEWEGIEYGARILMDFDRAPSEKPATEKRSTSRFNANQFLKIDPPLRGTFKWIAPNRAVYQIDEHPIPNESYTIKWKDSDQELTVKSQSFKCNTWYVLGAEDIPEQYRLFMGTLNPYRPKAILIFSHYVDIADLADCLTIQSSQTNATYPAEISTPKNSRASKVFLVTPKDDLELDQGFTIEITDKLKEKNSGRLITDSMSISFSTESFQVFFREHDGALSLDFNYMPDLKNKKPSEIVKVSPPVKMTILDDDGESWNFEGRFDPEIEYQFRVSSDLTSVQGLRVTNPGPHPLSGIQGYEFAEIGIIFPDRRVQYRTANGIDFSFKQTNLKSAEATVTFIPDSLFSDGPANYRVFNDVQELSFPEGYKIVNSKFRHLKDMPAGEANIKAIFKRNSKYYYISDYSWGLMEKGKDPNPIEADAAGGGIVGLLGENLKEEDVFNYWVDSGRMFIPIFKGCSQHKTILKQIPFLSGNRKTVEVGRFKFGVSPGKTVRSFKIPSTKLEGDGAYLIHAYGESFDGETHSNETIVLCSETVYTVKRTGYPTKKDPMAAEVTFKAFNARSGRHDRRATIPNLVKHYYRELAVPEHVGMRVNENMESADSGFHSADHHNLNTKLSQQYVLSMLTDRSTYLSSEDLHVYGLVRFQNNLNKQLILGDKEAVVELSINNDEERSEWSRKVSLTEFGSFTETIPLHQFRQGDYTISANVITSDEFEGLPQIKRITIDDSLRVPAYSVEVTASPVAAGGAPTATIRSLWRNGTPNIGAQVRWRAEWFVGGEHFGEKEPPYDSYAFTDYAPIPDQSSVVWKGDSRGLFTGGFQEERFGLFEGRGILDESGKLTVTAPPNRSLNIVPRRARIRWSAEVIADQNGISTNESGGASSLFQKSKDVLGLRFTNSKEDGTAIEVKSWDANGNETHGVPIRVNLIHVGIKTNRKSAGAITLPGGQKTAHTMVAFENEAYAKDNILTKETTTPAVVPFDPEFSGHYIAKVDATEDTSIASVTAECPLASATSIPGAMKHGEVVVNDDLSLRCTLNEKEYQPGDTAILTISAPFTGTAWVAVEADRVLYEEVITMDQNVKEVEIPVEDSFFPNAFVSVYMIKSGGAAGKPLERFGLCELKVSKDARTIKPSIDLYNEYYPREEIQARIKIRGQAGEKMEATVFVVDKNVQLLAPWRKPDFVSTFYPQRPLRVTTFRGADRYVTSIDPLILNKGGDIIGDGANYLSSSNTVFFDNEFTPTEWWSGLTPDENGIIELEGFEAPQTNSRFEMYVIVVSDRNRFGIGSKQFLVRRPVSIIPSLPKRLTETDRLSVPVRLNNNSEERIQATLQIESSGALEAEHLSEESISIPPKDGVNALVGIHAKQSGNGNIRFSLKYNDRNETDYVSRDIYVYEAESSLPFAQIGDTPAPTPVGGVLPKHDPSAKKLSYHVLVTQNPTLLSLEKMASVLFESSDDFRIEARRIIALAAIERMLSYYPKKSELVNEEALRNEIQIASQRIHSVEKTGLDRLLEAGVMDAKGKKLAFEQLQITDNDLAQTSEDIAESIFEFIRVSNKQNLTREKVDEFNRVKTLLKNNTALYQSPLFIASLSDVTREKETLAYCNQQIREQFDRIGTQSDLKKALLIYSYLFVRSDGIRADEYDRASEQIGELIDKWPILDLETKCWIIRATELQGKQRSAFQINERFMNIPPTQSPMGGATSWQDLYMRPKTDDEKVLEQKTLSYRVEGEQIYDDKIQNWSNRSSSDLELKRKILSFPLGGNQPIGVDSQAIVIYEISTTKDIGPCELQEPFPACMEWVPSKPNFLLKALKTESEIPETGHFLQSESTYVSDGFTRFRFSGIPKGTSYFAVLGDVKRAGDVIWQPTRFQDKFDKSVAALSDTRKIEVK